MRIAALLAGALLLPAAALAQTQAETRISQAFIHLGMAQNKAACYGQTIGYNLDQGSKSQAASIVETARDSRDVRQGVMQAGPQMINAFSAAHNRCGS
jgi:hypothetical protein